MLTWTAVMAGLGAAWRAARVVEPGPAPGVGGYPPIEGCGRIFDAPLKAETETATAGKEGVGLAKSVGPGRVLGIDLDAERIAFATCPFSGALASR